LLDDEVLREDFTVVEEFGGVFAAESEPGEGLVEVIADGRPGLRNVVEVSLVELAEAVPLESFPAVRFGLDIDRYGCGLPFGEEAEEYESGLDSGFGCGRVGIDVGDDCAGGAVLCEVMNVVRAREVGREALEFDAHPGDTLLLAFGERDVAGVGVLVERGEHGAHEAGGHGDAAVAVSGVLVAPAIAHYDVSSADDGEGDETAVEVEEVEVGPAISDLRIGTTFPSGFEAVDTGVVVVSDYLVFHETELGGEEEAVAESADVFIGEFDFAGEGSVEVGDDSAEAAKGANEFRGDGFAVGRIDFDLFDSRGVGVWKVGEDEDALVVEDDPLEVAFGEGGALARSLEGFSEGDVDAEEALRDFLLEGGDLLGHFVGGDAGDLLGHFVGGDAGPLCGRAFPFLVRQVGLRDEADGDAVSVDDETAGEGAEAGGVEEEAAVAVESDACGAGDGRGGNAPGGVLTALLDPCIGGIGVRVEGKRLGRVEGFFEF